MEEKENIKPSYKWMRPYIITWIVSAIIVLSCGVILSIPPLDLFSILAQVLIVLVAVSVVAAFAAWCMWFLKVGYDGPEESDIVAVRGVDTMGDWDYDD